MKRHVRPWVLLGLVLVGSAFAQEAPEDSAPELSLDGVIVARNPADSIALLRRAGSPRARRLRVGQEFSGYVLLQVSKGSVRLASADRELWLFLESRAGATGEMASPKPRLSREDEEVWIRRELSRSATRERLLREIPVILSETDFAPRIEGGEVRGMGVSRLPDGTLLSESGLLPGDVLLSINGEPVQRVDSLWELVARLLEENEIRVVVRRRGELLRLAYAFTN
jgi:type II secretion system protein C